jgi:hypothetical protein
VTEHWRKNESAIKIGQSRDTANIGDMREKQTKSTKTTQKTKQKSLMRSVHTDCMVDSCC